MIHTPGNGSLEYALVHAGPPPGHGQEAGRSLMPWPDVVLLKTTPQGATFLYRYTASGVFGGDTWHASKDEARDQATFEFPGSLGPWIPVPDGIEDAVAYVTTLARGAPRAPRG